MLTNTFVHIPGIGYLTERRIWEQGIRTWDEFMEKHSELPLSSLQKEVSLRYLKASKEQLACGNYKFFAQHLPHREYWRVYPEFAHSLVFLDIETTGLYEADYITLIGLFDGKNIKRFIRGVNLEHFGIEIQNYGVIVTYFGSRFDLPFIRRAFPQLPLDQIHIDLCYLLRRLGYSGGLKSVEEKLSVSRDESIRHLNGFDAVRLWREYERGSKEALVLLMRYNEADIVNLKTLLEFAYRNLKAQCFLF